MRELIKRLFYMYLNSNKLFVCKHFNTSFTGSISKICFKEDEAQPVVQRFCGQKQFKGTVPQKIREFFSFQSISFGLKWPGVNFQVILLKVHWRGTVPLKVANAIHSNCQRI